MISLNKSLSSMPLTWIYRFTYNVKLHHEMKDAVEAKPAPFWMRDLNKNNHSLVSNSSTDCSTLRTSRSESFQPYAEATTNGSERFSPELIEDSVCDGDSSRPTTTNTTRNAETIGVLLPKTMKTRVRINRSQRKYFSFKIRDINSSYPRSFLNRTYVRKSEFNQPIGLKSEDCEWVSRRQLTPQKRHHPPREQIQTTDLVEDISHSLPSSGKSREQHENSHSEINSSRESSIPPNPPPRMLLRESHEGSYSNPLSESPLASSSQVALMQPDKQIRRWGKGAPSSFI